MFVFDENGHMSIADFGFNGWGKKTPYKNDDAIPQVVSKTKDMPILNVEKFVLEGGSVELDGAGTAMLCKSSVTNENRNLGMSTEEAEKYMKQYLGATNFIWLDGVSGEDITDCHIDGLVKFVNDHTMLTIKEDDFFDLYEGIKESDYEKIHGAVNAQGKPYNIVELPLTKNNVPRLDYKGNYINFYVANNVVLVPIYDDPNDAVALDIIGKLYPNKKVVGIEVANLYQHGGMIHCVTLQQPATK